MLKKAVALGSLVASVSAMPTLAHASYFKSGWMAGAHVGVSNGTGTFNSTFDTNQIGAPSASGKARRTSALFGILGGYRHIFREGYTIGMDLTANIFANDELKTRLVHNADPVSFPFTNKLNRRFNVIPSINFGKIFCDRWHISLGLGLGISRFKQQVTNLTLTGGKIKSASSSTTKLGFVPSLGVEYAATQNISILGNVSYEIYKKINKKFDDQLTSPNLAGSSYTSSIRPQYLTLRIGVAYRF